MKTNTLIEESSKKWQGNEGEMKMRRKAHEAEKSGVVIKRTKIGERGGGSSQWEESVWYEPQHQHLPHPCVIVLFIHY